MRSKFTIFWKMCSEENNKVGDFGEEKVEASFFLRQKFGGSGEADVKIQLAFRVLSKYIGPDLAKREENSGDVFFSVFRCKFRMNFSRFVLGNLRQKHIDPG